MKRSSMGWSITAAVMGSALILFAGGSNKGIEEWEPLNDQMGIVMGMKGDERAAEVVNELPDLAVSPVNATLPMAEAASAESASDRAADGPDKHEESPVQAAPESRPVPTEPESSPATDVAETEDQSGLINVNTADAQTLMELPGIGEAKAKAIINHRTQFGPYRSVADLLEVKGIGPKMLEKMKPYVGL